MKSKSTKECQAIQEAIKTSNIWIINSSAWAILEKKKQLQPFEIDFNVNTVVAGQ